MPVCRSAICSGVADCGRTPLCERPLSCCRPPKSSLCGRCCPKPASGACCPKPCARLPPPDSAAATSEITHAANNDNKFFPMITILFLIRREGKTRSAKPRNLFSRQVKFTDERHFIGYGVQNYSEALFQGDSCRTTPLSLRSDQQRWLGCGARPSKTLRIALLRIPTISTFRADGRWGFRFNYHHTYCLRVVGRSGFRFSRHTD